MSDMVTVATSVAVLGQIANSVSRSALGTDMAIVIMLCDVALAAFLSPVSCYIGVGLMKDLAELDQQLQDFNVNESQCFCCSEQHVHPETGQALACDRVLIYDMLRRWYGASADVQEEHLERPGAWGWQISSLEFDKIVRTRLRESALRSVDDAKMPAGSIFFLSLMIPTPDLVEAIANAPLSGAFQNLGHFLARHVLSVALVAWCFWLYFKLCVFGAVLVQRVKISRLLAAFIASLMLLFSATSIYAAVCLPFFIPFDWNFLPLVALVWLLITVGLFKGWWCWKRCGCSMRRRAWETPPEWATPDSKFFKNPRKQETTRGLRGLSDGAGFLFAPNVFHARAASKGAESGFWAR
eukprot:s4156_g8.t1